jgi:hypothetical protein
LNFQGIAVLLTLHGMSKVLRGFGIVRENFNFDGVAFQISFKNWDF